MPGMMDTILNLGLNDVAVEGLARTTGNARFAYDSYRRLIQMYGEVVEGIDGHRFEQSLADLKSKRRVAARHRPHRRGPRGADRDVQGDLPREHGRRVPAGRTRSAAPRGRRGVRLLGEPARAGVPPSARDPGRPRHRGERRADGLRQPGRGLRRPASASRATRRRASRGCTASFSRTRRARTSSRGSARRSRSRRCRRGCPRRTSSCSRRCAASRSTTATCRTSSSPSRRGSSTCCRRAPRSARLPRR